MNTIFSSILFFSFPIFSYGKAAVTIIVTFLVTSWVLTAMVSLNFNYTHKIAEPLESFGYLYEKPYARLGPYIMGKLKFYQFSNDIFSSVFSQLYVAV